MWNMPCPRAWRRRRTGTCSPRPGPPRTVPASGPAKASSMTSSVLRGRWKLVISTSTTRETGGPGECTAGSCPPAPGGGGRLQGPHGGRPDGHDPPRPAGRPPRWRRGPSSARSAWCALPPARPLIGRNVPSPTARSTCGHADPRLRALGDDAFGEVQPGRRRGHAAGSFGVNRLVAGRVCQRGPDVRGQGQLAEARSGRRPEPLPTWAPSGRRSPTSRPGRRPVPAYSTVPGASRRPGRTRASHVPGGSPRGSSNRTSAAPPVALRSSRRAGPPASVDH